MDGVLDYSYSFSYGLFVWGGVELKYFAEHFILCWFYTFCNPFFDRIVTLFEGNEI